MSRKSKHEKGRKNSIAAAQAHSASAQVYQQEFFARKITDSSENRWDRWMVPGICIFLAALAWIVFGQTIHFDFVNYNDDVYVYDNPVVKGGLSIKAIEWAFTHAQVANWIPLTVLSYMSDCEFFGVNAGGHHFVNVLLHAASVVLLFLVLWQMTGAIWRCAFVAALFAVHPLRAESVAWVSERKDVLSGLFFMLSIGAFVRYVREPSRGRYVVMLVLFALGLLAKSMIATLPFVLLLLDYWPLKRFRNWQELPALLLEKVPLLALSAGACIAVAMVPGLLITGERQLPRFERIEVALMSCVIYLRKMVFPAGLAIPYPYPANSLPSWKFCLALVTLTVISMVVSLCWKKRPYLLIGWLWYLGMLFPVIGIVQITSVAAYADRYTYLPGIGLAIAVTWVVADWSAWWRYRQAFLAGLMMVIVSTYAVCGYKQTSYWRNSKTLWERAIACTAPNVIAHDNLGVYFVQNGESNQGIAEYEKALAIKSEDLNARINLGVALFAKGDLKGAIAEYQKALENDPGNPVARNNLGNALIKNGQTEDGIAQYRKVLEVDPSNEDTRFNLGFALMAKGDLPQAIAEYEKVLEKNPGDGEVRNNLACALAQNGKLEDAIFQYGKILEANPDSVDALNNLGAALLAKGDLKGAIAQYRKVLEITPDHAETVKNLGIALLRQEDGDEAMACFAKILVLGSDPLDRWYCLGNDFLQNADWEDAIICYKRALHIQPKLGKARAQLGVAYFQQGDGRRAIDSWEQSLVSNPGQLDVLNNLAWVLATSPDASLRNGARAVFLAEAARQRADTNSPAVLRTLAAAYAEDRRYREAAATARIGLALAVKQTNNILAGNLQREIKFYDADMPLPHTR